MLDHRVRGGEKHDLGAAGGWEGAEDSVDAVAGIFDEDDVGGWRVDVGGEGVAGAAEQLLVPATEPSLVDGVRGAGQRGGGGAGGGYIGLCVSISQELELVGSDGRRHVAKAATVEIQEVLEAGVMGGWIDRGLGFELRQQG